MERKYHLENLKTRGQTGRELFNLEAFVYWRQKRWIYLLYYEVTFHISRP